MSFYLATWIIWILDDWQWIRMWYTIMILCMMTWCEDDWIQDLYYKMMGELLDKDMIAFRLQWIFLQLIPKPVRWEGSHENVSYARITILEDFGFTTLGCDKYWDYPSIHFGDPPSKSDKTLYTGIYLPTLREGTHFIIKLVVLCPAFFD